MKIRNIIFIFLLFLTMIGTASAATRDVGTGYAYSTIQAALSASSSGDSVHVHAGTYTISTALSIPSGVTLYGDGYDVTIIKANAPLDFYSSSNPALIYFNGDSDIEVYGFTFHGNGRSLSAMHDIDNAYRNYCSGIKLSDSSDITIHDCYFTLTYGDSIRSGGDNTNIYVYDCIFNTPGHDALSMYYDTNYRMSNCIVNTFINAGMRIERCSGAEVDHCTFYSDTSSGSGGVELLRTVGSDVKVHNNIMRNMDNTGGYGIFFYSWSSGYVNLSYNVMYDCPGGYITAASGSVPSYYSTGNQLGASPQTESYWVALGYGFDSSKVMTSTGGDPGDSPVASFSANSTSGVAPKTVAFTDSSTGTPISWSWNFGDGYTSTSQNPTHTYSSIGTYTVSLTVTNAYGSDSETKSNYITVSTIPPVASFSANSTSGVAPKTVAFFDNSTGTPTSWSWNFGDGTTSTAQNPTHTYSSTGTYTVTLTTTNSYGSDSETKSNYIILSENNQAYITNQWNNTVTIVDITTDSITGYITVGETPFGASVSPDGSRVYVVNQDDNTVSVINTSTNNVVATIGVGVTPYCVVVSPDSSTVYVTNYGSNTTTVIDANTNTVIKNITVGFHPRGITISPNGNRVYVSNWDGDSISVINTYTNTVTNTINIGGDIYGIAASDSTIYTSVYFDAAISVIDTTNHTVYTSIDVGTNPFGIAISHDFSRLYVTNHGSNTVSVINTNTNSVIATIPVGINPRGVAVSPDDSKVYVSNWGSNTISVINTATNTISKNITGFNHPNGLGPFIQDTTLDSSKPITSNFSVNVVSGNSPLTVQFIDTSIGSPTSWRWSFGDGSTSTEQNPTHTYYSSGVYNVTLFAQGGTENQCKDSAMEMCSVFENSNTTPQWNYAENIEDGRGITFGAVGFTTGTYDGNILIKYYTTLNPENDLAKYIPALDAIDAGPHPDGLNDDLTGLDGFAEDIENCDDPLFKQAQIYQIDQLYWDPAVVKYRNIGANTNITLAFIYDCCVNHGLNGAQSIIDSATTTCDGTPGSGIDEVEFLRAMIDARNSTYNKISRDTSWSNLLNTGNLGLNTPYSFSAYGDSFVIDGDLDISTAYFDTYTVENLITVNNAVAAPVAAFSVSSTNGYPPISVSFYDLSSNTPTSWSWNFGDGYTSTSQNPTHTYSSIGTYTVSLTVTNAYGSDSEVKTSYINIIDTGVTYPVTTNHIIVYQDQIFTVYTLCTEPIRWYVDNVLQSDTDANLTTSISKFGNHYIRSVSAENITYNWTVTVKRTMATVQIERQDETNYDNIMADIENEDIEGAVETTFTPFTDLIGRAFYMILFVLPFIVIWKSQGSISTPTILALIFGCLFIGFIPEQYVNFIILTITLAFAVGLYSLVRDRS